MLNFENLDKFIPVSIGRYAIPQIEPVEYDRCDWIPFNYAKTCKVVSGKGVHFFIDDYQFTRLWIDVNKYVPILKKFNYVMSPDFSTFTDMPPAMQIYNHYRKHWLGAYYQAFGIKVIPTISWSNEDSFEWCFDGEPINSVIAISTVGCMNREESKELFFAGYEEMKQVLTPSKILCYGKIPDNIKDEVEYIGCYYDKIVAERVALHGR
ncbi:MAG: DUF4417 domain-containing protein [Methanobacterium sp.]